LIALAGFGAANALAIAALKNFYETAAHGRSPLGQGYGSLKPDPQGILDLPEGFRYVVLSREGDRMSDGSLVPSHADGMAALAGANGSTILIRNHELRLEDSTRVEAAQSKRYDPVGRGGTTTLIVGSDRKLMKQYVSLAGTSTNCAGGATPWGSWVSCEETTLTPATQPTGTSVRVTKPHGYNFEVPKLAAGPVDPTPLVAMGRFRHEAIAVDPRTGIVYQTEDQNDGLFYRFIPKQRGNLVAGGVLEALRIPKIPKAITRKGFPVEKPMAVDWVPIEEVNPQGDTVRVEGFHKGAAQFSRGEGICYTEGSLYFTCTNGGEAGVGQVWRYSPGRNPQEGGTIALFVESPSPSVLDFPDNLVMAPFGDLILCEDGAGEQRVMGLTSGGELYPLAHNALNNSEFAGVCFSPNGQTMFLNIYRPSVTLAIWGPWRKV
jgi:hypothetical protein